MRNYLIILSLILCLASACSSRTTCPADLEPLSSAELSGLKGRQMQKSSKTNPFLGVAYQIVATNVYTEAKADHGYLIIRIESDSAADNIGLQTGDIILEFDGVTVDSITPAENRTGYLHHYIRERKKIGDTLCLKILRLKSDIQVDGINESTQPGNLEDLKIILDQQPPDKKYKVVINNQIEILYFDAVLSERRNRQPDDLPANRHLFPEYEELRTPYTLVTDKFVEKFNLQSQYEDIKVRYSEEELWDNGFRLNLFRYLHRDPQKLVTVIDMKTEKLLGLSETAGLAKLLLEAADWLDVKPPFVQQDFPQANARQVHIDYITETLKRSMDQRQHAFAGLSSRDIVFLEDQLPKLMQRFSYSYDINQLDGQEENSNNLKIIELAKKVDYQNLVQSGLILAELADLQWLSTFKQAMLTAPESPEGPHDGISGDILYYSDTALGPVIVGGTGRNIYKVSAAIIIDLGGDDLYQGSAGLVQDDQHISVTIDLEGNDEYMATDQFAQGCGMLGIGLLFDQQGDDLYLGTRFSQGCAVMGLGVLADRDGNDSYIGLEFNQGIAFWGIGMLIDSRGNDRFHSNMFAQGVGGTKGFGALINNQGDDIYFAGGRDRSSYGTPGIFKGSSQGLGIGFRGYSSGGIGMLLDGSGDDNFWAGNFSQGTGYFYGMGIIRNFGRGDDTYMASRYGQGASAHSAIGILLDDEGNDHYDGYHVALQGAAWDLGIAALVDKKGNDVYKRNAGWFSQAAAAHNGMSLFIDEEGDDSYMGEQGLVDSNDYQGGFSLAVFIDAGGGRDIYSNGTNNTITCSGEYGIRADLAASLLEVLKDQNYWGSTDCRLEINSSIY